VPKRYGIRFYPDITHSLRSQYPVPDWDVAYALTLQREPINPRPMDEAQIFRLLQPFQQAGFLTYSEGCNDDVNKFVWSGLGWNPDSPVSEILREYSRYFIGGDLTEPFAQGLLALERNWRGPLKSNTGVDTTLAQFREMEAKATPAQKLNWRFQQALYRAYYDAFIRARLLAETAQEERAMTALRDAKRTGAMHALAAAESALQPHAVASDLRARVFELAEALFQSIRMQLSVAKYQAIAVGRGANLDLIDHPLNDAPWLRERFAGIRKMGDEAERLKAIDEIVNWTNPGPGGFYDDLGDPLNQPHLVRNVTFDKDPAYLHGAMTSFTARPPFSPLRMSWWTEAQTLNEQPMEMQYRDLDRTAQYRVRIVYSGDNTPVPVRLAANDKFEIHPMKPKPTDFHPVEFDIPKEATSGGELKLTWTKPAGLGGNGRGVQVAEIWLIRK
jgi:hypothetical protein